MLPSSKTRYSFEFDSLQTTWFSTSHIFPARFLSSKFEVNVREECLAFLQVYSCKIDACIGVCIDIGQLHLRYYLAVVI
ncbi:hypothetical protein POPTR_019G120400v4 [Populus trichocarpa]|jgi:hypothetical protein|uniref:Uncharacterized protein n=1 Tax=Populus trichocarpa TaxID=3694 RepID=A0ACC0RKM4_POPTR|nr:hypothetical protein POPTR_019G120400v4 [Populus trichocarpa]